MDTARARRILIAALAISLLLHAIFAGYLRWPFLQPAPEETIAKVRITHIARIPPHSPPPHTPAPIRTPLVRASIAPPSLTPKRGKGPAIVKTLPVSPSTPAPRATIAPTPAVSTTPSGPCAGHANADPAVAATPDSADIAPEARTSKVSGTAAVRVSLDGQGRVLGATVAQSSGNAGLDAAAVRMARDATYTPKYVDCKAVAGDYTFTVRFFAW